jgi:hypothetical protein
MEKQSSLKTLLSPIFLGAIAGFTAPNLLPRLWPNLDGLPFYLAVCVIGGGVGLIGHYMSNLIWKD